jgi:pSer/pThr/pTyr-binding forkhead associated (FHA) protein
VPLAGVMIVGRTPESGLRLPVGTVSRRHAELEPTPAGWVVRDLHSENGTWVNGERIWEKLLADGDRVQFGSVALIFRLD